MNEFGEREIRLFGSMGGGRALVIGPWPFNPSSPAYSTSGRGLSIAQFSTLTLAAAVGMIGCDSGGKLRGSRLLRYPPSLTRA
jgi:hypothetical protein